MKRRSHAYTLIEIIAVLTVLSLVWLCITSALYKLHRADHHLRDDLQREQALDRLAMRLRLDAREASSAELLGVPERGDELVLSAADDRTIHYGMSDEGVYRVVQQGGAVLHRDSFLTGRAKSEWMLQPADEPALIVLSLTARDGRTQAARVRQIKAAVTPVRTIRVKAPETSS